MRIAEIIGAAGVDGRLGLDEHYRFETRLARMRPRHEVQNMMRDRHDLLVRKGGFVSNGVDQRTVSTRRTPATRFGDE
jgi:hypothetical protein